MNSDTGQAILTIIKSKYSNSYYNEAPIDAAFPYAVFTTPSTFQLEGTERIILEIDIWDNKGNNISSLESATKTLKDGLKKYVYIDDNIYLKFELESLLQIPDPEEQLRRRQLRFIVKYIDRR
jgi:hypothetical protein